MPEPQLQQQLKIEVFPAGFDEPVLVKEKNSFDFTPTKPGALARPTPGRPRGKPTMTESIQSNKPLKSAVPVDSGWKVKQPHRPPTGTTPKPSRIGRIPDVSRGVALGSFLNGIIDELVNTPREQTYRNNILYKDLGNRAIYDAGRSTADFFEDVFDTAKDFYKDMWDNRPDVDFPEIDFPSLELPKIDFPQFDLPKFDLPDFDPFNIFDRQREQDRQRRKQNENDARQRRRDYDQTDDEKLEKFKNNLPDSCGAVLFFITHRILTNIVGDRRNGNYQISERRPGAGYAEPVNSTYDRYGNRRDYYPEASGGAGIDMYYPFDVTLGTFVILPDGKNGSLHREAYHDGIRNTTDLNNLFKFRDGDDLGSAEYGGEPGYLINRSDYKLYGVQVYCELPPPRPPFFYDPPPPPQPDPPDPPDPPEEKEEDPMSCCSCDDIAQIFQVTLGRLRYNITVPIVSCELVEGVWIPKVEAKSLEVFANSLGTATAQAELYRELAVQAQGNCEAKNLSNKIYEVIGGDEYPAEVPESLISKDEGWLGNLIPNKTKKLKNLTEFLSWYVERFDEILGQWEIPIEIKDSDPSKPGDQPKGVKLPNMAEAIAEMFTLLFQTNLNSETMLNIAMRNLAETAQDKQQNFVSYKLLQSLTDYIGFKQKDISLKMPLLFTLNKTRYDEILKESEVEVGCVEFDDKFGLEADLMRFREGVAILQAVHKRKLDPNGDIKAQILKYLLDTYRGTERVNGDDDADFEDFLKEVEVGFTNTAGINNATEPYGRPFTQRPRIRDLTNYEPPTQP